MRRYLLLLVLACVWCMHPGPMVYAQQDQAADTQAVIDRGHHLKTLLDQLLSNSNHSSIHKALEAGGDSADPLIEEALRLKSDGERLLEQEEYVQAAMTLQSSLDMVFQAIRSEGDAGHAGNKSGNQVAEAKAINDTFIEAATRVVGADSNSEAVSLLASARDARARAEASENKGDTSTALQEFDDSTQLAQKAIMSVRNGMVIERGQ